MLMVNRLHIQNIHQVASGSAEYLHHIVVSYWDDPVVPPDQQPYVTGFDSNPILNAAFARVNAEPVRGNGILHMFEQIIAQAPRKVSARNLLSSFL